MRSLADLNTVSVEQIEFTDNRLPGPVFNRPLVSNVETAIFDVFNIDIDPSIDIIELIRPAEAQLTYRIDVSAADGAVLVWDSILPVGVVVSEISGEYIITGLDSLTKWNAVKSPTIQIPETFQGAFFYTISIEWNDTVRDQSISWQVGVFLPITNMAASSSMVIEAENIKGLYRERLIVTAILQTQPIETLGAQFFVSCTALRDAQLVPSTITATASIDSEIYIYTDFIDRFDIKGDDGDPDFDNNFGNVISFSKNSNVFIANNGQPNQGAAIFNQNGGLITRLSQSGVDNITSAAYGLYNNGSYNVQHAVFSYNGTVYAWRQFLSNSWQSYTTTSGNWVKINKDKVLIASNTNTRLLTPNIGTNSLDQLWSINYTPDYIDLNDNYVAITDSNSITIHDINDGSLIYTISNSDNVTGLALNNKNQLAVTSITNTKIYNLVSQTLERTINQGTASISGDLSDQLVSISNIYVAISKYTSPLTVYLYELNTGNLSKTFTNPNINTSSSSDAFGKSVALNYNDSRLAIGAPLEDTDTTDAGIIYIYY